MNEGDLFWTVFSRDQGRCFHCGATQNLEMHHLIPKSKKGQDHFYNCIMVCGPVVDSESCHYKIHNGEKSHARYLCTGYWHNIKLLIVIRDIKKRQRKNKTWEKF